MDDRPPSQRSDDDLPVDAEASARTASRSADERAFDEAIGRALFDVAVPQGMLARLAAIPQEGVREDRPLPVEVATPVRSGGISRRAALYGGVALATAASLGIGVWLLEPATDFEDWNEETLSRRAIAWTTHLELEAGAGDGWTAIDAERTERSLGQWIRQAPEAVGRYRLSGTNDRRFVGDVYRFGPAQRANAMLFVVDAATLPGDLPASPPATPGWTSEGFAVGMWRRGGKLYVVAVRGDAKDYAQLIRRQTVA
jgi:hypothetical protein